MRPAARNIPVSVTGQAKPTARNNPVSVTGQAKPTARNIPVSVTGQAKPAARNNPVSVNGQVIPASLIGAEAQNHPARSAEEAWAAAAEALVIRTLLLQEAASLGLVAEAAVDDGGRRESDDDALVRALVRRELAIAAASEEACRDYHDGNPERFRSPELFAASHILFAARRDDARAWAAAETAAGETLKRLADRPGDFERLAAELSDCSSGRNGGNLGQLRRGDTVPEFETFLLTLEPGRICPAPVKTRFGVHVMRLDHRAEGRILPYEAVARRIADYLNERAYRMAARRYVAGLVARADVRGVELSVGDGLREPETVSPPTATDSPRVRQNL